jgi:hypothetical protein
MIRITIIGILLLAALPACLFSDELVQAGGPCTEEGQYFHLTSGIIKSPWELNDLYALPPGSLSPESWQESSSFHTQFNMELEGISAESFADACSAVWQGFFSEEADIIVKVHRSISATHQMLQCTSGYWISLSTEALQMNDTSDWITLEGSPYDVGVESASAIEADLQYLLDTLNMQPGAASESTE